MRVRALCSIIGDKCQVYQGFMDEDGERNYRDITGLCYPEELPDEIKDLKVKYICSGNNRTVLIQVQDAEPELPFSEEVTE